MCTIVSLVANLVAITEVNRSDKKKKIGDLMRDKK